MIKAALERQKTLQKQREQKLTSGILNKVNEASKQVQQTESAKKVEVKEKVEESKNVESAIESEIEEVKTSNQ